MKRKLSNLMAELQFAEKKLSELNTAYLQAVREEMEFAHFDKGISDYYKSAIEAIESTIALRRKDIDAIEDNEVFISRFGEELHTLYKKDNPGFDKFTKLEDVETSWHDWNYSVHPMGSLAPLFDADSSPSAAIPTSALPELKTAEFVTYKNKSLYLSFAFAPEINTVFVRK